MQSIGQTNCKRVTWGTSKKKKVVKKQKKKKSSEEIKQKLTEFIEGIQGSWKHNWNEILNNQRYNVNSTIWNWSTGVLYANSFKNFFRNFLIARGQKGEHVELWPAYFNITWKMLKKKYENDLFSWIDWFELREEVFPIVFNPISTCPDDKLNTSKIPFLQIDIYNLFSGKGG